MSSYYSYLESTNSLSGNLYISLHVYHREIALRDCYQMGGKFFRLGHDGTRHSGNAITDVASHALDALTKASDFL